MDNTAYIFIALGVIVFLVIFVGIMAIIYKIFKALQVSVESMKSKSLRNNSQDFSAFETSPDKFRSSLEADSDEVLEEDEEAEDTIKGDMFKLEEFLDTIKSQPRETLSSIHISKDEESDLLIAIEVDEEEGLFMEAYHPEEETTIPYPQWLSAMRSIIQELSLDAEEINEEDAMVTITLEGKPTKEIKQLIERILSEGYLNKLGNNFSVEYLA